MINCPSMSEDAVPEDPSNPVGFDVVSECLAAVDVGLVEFRSVANLGSAQPVDDAFPKKNHDEKAHRHGERGLKRHESEDAKKSEVMILEQLSE